MIIRFPGRRPAPESDASETPRECACGHRNRARAVYCRRCGSLLPGRTPQARHAAPEQVPTAALLRWERLRRPKGATARAARAARTSRGDQASGSRRRSVVHRVPPLADELSARRTLTESQVVVGRLVTAALALGVVINASAAMTLVVALATLLYAGSLVYRVWTFTTALSAPDLVSVSDEEARGLWERSLPNYTVLVPAYREPEVIGQLIRRLDRLDYPRDRLDIKLLVEQDDVATVTAARNAVTGAHYEIIEIPYSEPRTKPKALNIGLRRARGRRGHGLVTIYDAEDRPDPLQLRRAVAAFRRLRPEIACLQAKLAYYNADQNIITRWFTVEYAMWFNQLLPGLVAQGTPLPLGGTSNHFRRGALEALGGWDAYNVTEDADLGIRLHRAGYRTAVLDSVTEEEANSDFVNWVKQRSRWYKGYIQTWLVHMRHPVQLARELGPMGFLGFHLFVGGTPLLTVLNPLFWTMTALWFVAHPAWIASIFPAWLYYASVFCLVFGNAAFVYTSLVSARTTGRPNLVLAAGLSAAYWVMMSIAAIKALVQLVDAPSFWEKTVHGLDRDVEPEVRRRAAA